MKVVKPPTKISKTYKAYKTIVFLAGSIEMGAAEMWQDEVARHLEEEEGVILNPRRDYWDSSWVQSKDNPLFREQVEWELTGAEDADITLFYFDPNTKSPITLLELGINAATGKYVIVVCPDGFWRKGNVDIICERYGLNQFATLREATDHIREIA